MEGDIVVRKVAQDVQMFVWHKQEIISKKPSPELSFVPDISAAFLKNLCIAVWIDSYSNDFTWKEYLDNHFKRMIASPYLFANYVYYACDIVNRSASDAYEGFCDTISLITHFVLYCWQAERKEFLNTCVDLFCAFFEDEIRTKFEDQGSWQNFNEYLVENHGRLIRCKELIRANQPEYEIFKEIQNEDVQNGGEPYVIDGVVLKSITGDTVEHDDNAVNFAESVTSIIRDLCKQSLQELLANFAKTDKQVEEFYRQMVGEAAGGIEMDAEQSALEKDEEDSTTKAKDVQQSSQEDREALLGKESTVKQSSPRAVPGETLKSNPRKKKAQALELDSPKSEAFGSATRESDLSPVSTNSKMARMRLEAMLEDIPKIEELIKFVCKGNLMEPVGAVETA